MKKFLKCVLIAVVVIVLLALVVWNCFGTIITEVFITNIEEWIVQYPLLETIYEIFLSNQVKGGVVYD